MNKTISSKIKNLILKKIEKSEGKIGICVLNSNSDIIFAYNEKKQFDTACSIMSFIMLEYFNQLTSKIISGEELVTYTEENYATGSGVIKFLTYGKKIKAKDLVELMITISDHIAANMLIDFLKLENINKTIQNYKFLNTKLNHKFLIPKLKNMGVSTPYELSLFYQKLDTNVFFNKIICSEMKKILLKQKYKDILSEKIIISNSKLYIDVACKSGKADGRIYNPSVDSYIADAGIFYTQLGNYNIAIMGELSLKSKVSLNDLKSDMQDISKLIYQGVIGD